VAAAQATPVTVISPTCAPLVAVQAARATQVAAAHNTLVSTALAAVVVAQAAVAKVQLSADHHKERARLAETAGLVSLTLTQVHPITMAVEAAALPTTAPFGVPAVLVAAATVAALTHPQQCQMEQPTLAAVAAALLRLPIRPTEQAARVS
jgi:hypothetical protein